MRQSMINITHTYGLQFFYVSRILQLQKQKSHGVMYHVVSTASWESGVPGTPPPAPAVKLPRHDISDVPGKPFSLISFVCTDRL